MAVIRHSLFPPGGPPDSAPIDVESPLCTDKAFAEEQRNAVHVDPCIEGIPAATLLLPVTYKPRSSPVLPPQGGGLWGGERRWAWEEESPHGPLGVANAALVVWFDSTAGYPTIAAAYGTTIDARSECRHATPSRVLHMLSFTLSYPGNGVRFFVVAASRTGTAVQLKALFHSPTVLGQSQGRTILRSVSLLDT